MLLPLVQHAAWNLLSQAQWVTYCELRGQLNAASSSLRTYRSWQAHSCAQVYNVVTNVNLGPRTDWPQICVLPAGCSIGTLHGISVPQQRNHVDCGPLALVNVHTRCRHLRSGRSLHDGLRFPKLSGDRQRLRQHLAQEMVEGVLDFLGLEDAVLDFPQ